MKKNLRSSSQYGLMMRSVTLCLLTQSQKGIELVFVFLNNPRIVIELKMLHLCYFSVEKYQTACFAILIVHFYVLLTTILPQLFFNCALL